MGRSDLAGFFVWQFFDMRTDGGARALGRPRSFNNKGLLDEYRRPKLAYYAVRDLLHRGASSSE
jgi:beta-glucuronidase